MKNMQFSQEEFEIANSIIKNIQNGNISSRGLASIDRILNIYFQRRNRNANEEKQVINFMFSCLDFYGIDASLLFKNAEKSKEINKIITRLHSNYKGKFDWNMVNYTIFEQSNYLISINIYLKLIIFFLSLLIIFLSILSYYFIKNLQITVFENEINIKLINENNDKLQKYSFNISNSLNKQININKNLEKQNQKLSGKLKQNEIDMNISNFQIQALEKNITDQNITIINLANQLSTIRNTLIKKNDEIINLKKLLKIQIKKNEQLKSDNEKIQMLNNDNNIIIEELQDKIATQANQIEIVQKKSYVDEEKAKLQNKIAIQTSQLETMQMDYNNLQKIYINYIRNIENQGKYKSTFTWKKVILLFLLSFFQFESVYTCRDSSSNYNQTLIGFLLIENLFYILFRSKKIFVHIINKLPCIMIMLYILGFISDYLIPKKDKKKFTNICINLLIEVFKFHYFFLFNS